MIEKHFCCNLTNWTDYLAILGIILWNESVIVNSVIAGLAAQCLSSLRTTFQYGGRKNVPSKVEVEAVTVSICLKDCYSSYYMKDLPTF